MKKVMKCFVLILLASVLFSIIWGCSTINTPPSYQHIGICFERDQEDILLVKEYLCNSGYTDIYINEDWQTAFADFEQIEICDHAVISALQRLKRKGYKEINKFENTIEFELWNGLRDISCGIAFVSQGSENAVPFLTEAELLEAQEWYYYIADYNEWRSGKKTD